MPGPRAAPWIVRLILSYDSREGSSSSSSTSSSIGGRLTAHVIGVGPMSQSQAQGSVGPTRLLFLSDGVFQIPAILTASAWEHLQEKEDRECFTSLLNATVHIQDYQLQFHLAPEQTKCRFYLIIGDLATTAAGTIKDNTPCCTTLPSVRQKIYETWRDLMDQRKLESQRSQCRFDVSELLGEWQQDCMELVLEDVKERLTTMSSHPVDPQPSTSTSASSLTYPDTFTAGSWDVNRVRYKGVKCFSVPLKCLLIPEEDAQQPQMPANVGSSTPSGLSGASEDRKRDVAQVCKPSETAQPSVGDWRLAKSAGVETDPDASENSPFPVEHSMLHEDMIAGMIDSDIRPLSNPWDIFPPCDTYSSSDASPEATPTLSSHKPTNAGSKTNQAAIVTSTQLPVHSSKESLQRSENSKGEHSYLPPYQKPPSLPAGSSTSTSVSPPEAFTRPSNMLPATEEHSNDTAQQHFPALDQESQILEKNMEETVVRKCRKAKRKRSEPTSETLTTLVEEEEEKEEGISGSPPSWLFHTQAGSGAGESCSPKPVQTVGTVTGKTPAVHSDGRPFSYSYQVSGQNLQDLSQFEVGESLLHWAVKYLVVPKQTDNPHNTSVTSTQTSSDKADAT